METITVSEIAAAIGVNTGYEKTIKRISTDSRDVDGDTLFVALQGERFDANDFVADVLAGDVGAVVCSRDFDDERVLRVDDTLKAFLSIGKMYRERYDIPFVALTGSVGKTTTKGMVHAVINRKLRALKTKGNLNNEIGVPKTLFELDKSYEAAVIEMGMNHAGEISRISQAVMPDIGIITNIGTAHIENLGSRRGILNAKLEILDGMKKGSVLIVNGDNDMLSSVSPDDYRVLRFGIEGEDLYIRAEDIVETPLGSTFTAVCGDEKTPVKVPAVGRHNIYNALCAICTGTVLGFSLADAAAGVEDFEPEGMRQRVTVKRGITFIEDCYNANPDSMKAALKTLASISTGRSVAVLSDMLELGDYSETAHRETGSVAASLGIDCIYCFGSASRFIAASAAENGVKDAKMFDDKSALTEYLLSFLKEGDTVLFKGSRSMQTEDVFQSLYKEWDV